MAGYDPSTYLDNENALEDIIEDIPKLISVREFAQKSQTVRWFQDVGEAPDADLLDVARSYLDQLGFPHVEPAFIADWEDAESAAESLDWDTAGWEAEEQLRSSLVSEALTDLSEEALSVALNHVSAAAGLGLQDHIENIAAIWDVENQNLMNAAAGAAVQACHNAALVLAADMEKTHPLALKFRLFEMGRWPISIAGSTFNIF